MTPRSLTAALVLAATAATVSATTYLDANRPEARYRITLDAGACVIPDCRTLLGRGAWVEHEVDCHAVGPYSQDGGPVWRGCVVMPREYTTGAACLPARCSVVAGEDPLEPMP